MSEANPYLDTEANPYLEAQDGDANPYLDHTVAERAANAGTALLQGIGTSVGQSISGAARTSDTVRTGSLLTSVPTGSARPTMKQGRRAFEQAMEDPRYMNALLEAGDDPAAQATAENLFGPTGRLSVIRAPIDAGRKASADESVAQQDRLKESPTWQFGQAVTKAARETFATNPYLDQKVESKLARALGSTAPTVALSFVPGVGVPAAVSQYALSQSEDMAQEATDAGRPDLALQAATAGLFIGALSEATLGATARMRSLLQSPTKIAALEGWAKANPIKATALIGGLRETAQEGTEQGLQNLTASDLVGYDPGRPWHRQVLESAALGGATGMLLGGGGAALKRATTKAPAKEPATDNPEHAEMLAELNAAVDALQAEPGNVVERSEELQAPAPQVQTHEGTPVFLPAMEEKLTPEQKMAREASEAMAELRALKAQRAAEATAPATPAVEGQAPRVPDSAERPAETIEPPQSPATESPAPNVRKGTEMPAEAGATPAPETSPKPPARRRVIELGPRQDGVPDVLDAIADIGGIRAPGENKGTGEYDGYAAAFNQGGPAASLRGGSQPPNLLLRDLQSRGFRFESVDQMYESVIRAGNAREAITKSIREEKAANKLRPERVEEVQALYDAALAGQPLSTEQLVELESRLNQKELKSLNRSLEKLRTMAGVAVPEAGEQSPIEAAKSELREAWGDMQTMGIMADPQRDAEKVFNFYKALFKLARAYAKAGIRSAAEFAEKVGLKLNAVVQAAWDDAQSGKAKTSALQFEPGTGHELAEGFRERKFSTRFNDDERIDPAIREATGNRQYQPIGNELTVTQALAIIQEQGLDAAIAMMKDERNRDLSDRERVALGEAIITKANHEYAQTKSEAALDKAVDVAEWLTEYGTRLGQGVQAFAIWNRLTPDGYVRTYVKAIKRAQRKAREKAGTGAVDPKNYPDIDEKTKREIHKAAEDALKQPEGFQRDEAIIDVLAKIARAKSISKLDLAIALWYANILSGWTTQTRNLAGNVSNLLAESMAHAAVRPQQLPNILAGLFNGALRGLPEAGHILRTGKVTGTRVGKVDVSPALELVHFKGIAYPLNAWKYVFRVMAATDMVFFRSAEEMQARFMAREIVRKEGLTGNAMATRLAELLHNTPELTAIAQQQATAEGLTGGRHKRRVGEIIEQHRPPELVLAAADMGRFTTFNQDPQGVLGVFSSAIAGASRRFAPLRLVVPFTRVVANVTNNALNFTPWGYRRLFPSVFTEENWMKPDAAPLDYQLQAARATLGTLALTALYALAVQYRDDEDAPFMLTANGPQNPGQRNQLRETGWAPYTVKIGDRYWSYRETPLHLVMATLGSLLDAQRYKKLDEVDSFSRFAYALRQIGTAPLNQSFLRGLSEFFEGLSDDRVPRSGARFNGLSRTVSSMAVPNLAKQVDRLFDPTIYDAGTVAGAFIRDIPVARQGLKPSINVLGETIKADQNPFYSVERRDPLWTVIGHRQLWIPVPSKTTMIGDRPITPEEYRALIETRGAWLSKQLRRPETMNRLATARAELAQDYVDRYSTAATAYAKAKLKLR